MDIEKKEKPVAAEWIQIENLVAIEVGEYAVVEVVESPYVGFQQLFRVLVNEVDGADSGIEGFWHGCLKQFIVVRHEDSPIGRRAHRGNRRREGCS